jgi:hypothetical protein
MAYHPGLPPTTFNNTLKKGTLYHLTCGVQLSPPLPQGREKGEEGKTSSLCTKSWIIYHCNTGEPNICQGCQQTYLAVSRKNSPQL